jgi:hypothetical protein
VSAFCTEAEARALFHRVATSPFTLRREQPVLSYSLFVAVCLQREEFMRLDLAWTAFNRCRGATCARVDPGGPLWR